jgi:hypothetical protein
MKYIKMLGLAAVAAATLMAFIGAGSASATTIHSSGGKLPKGTTINAVLRSGTEAVLQAGFGNIACGESTVHGITSTTGGAAETVEGNIGTLTFGACTGDTVTVLKTGVLAIHHIAGTTNGTLTGFGSEATTVSHNVGGVHCIYRTETTDLGALTGNNKGNAVVHVDTTLHRVPTSFLCKSTATWTATYEVTSPSPLWVEAG